MHLSNLRKYRGLFSSLDLLNKCGRVSGSSPDISPLRGLTGYVRASKDADYEYWLVPDNKVGSEIRNQLFFRNDEDFHLPHLSPVRGRVVKRTIARPKALSQTNSEILSDLKMNKFPACYGENTAQNRFFTTEPSTCSKNH